MGRNFFRVIVGGMVDEYLVSCLFLEVLLESLVRFISGNMFSGFIFLDVCLFY